MATLKRSFVRPDFWFLNPTSSTAAGVGSTPKSEVYSTPASTGWPVNVLATCFEKAFAPISNACPPSG